MNTNALRQKLLDLAIHGKLVKQDPADEPASVMLEKLRAEKKAKIAAGEIKRNKNDSYIFKYTGTSGENKTDDNPEGLVHNRHYEKFADGRVKDIEDEIPFAVPEGWAWCRLGEVCSFLNGFAFNSKEFKNTGIPIIRISNIAYEKVDISNCVYSSELLHEDFVAKKGDLLVALSGATTGKMGIYGEEQKAYINQRVGNIRIVVNNTIIPEYRNFFLYSQSKKILTKAYGGAQPNIGGKDILEILLPLPPLAEQKRIVTAIETIFTQIDILEQNQADLQTVVKQAKSKILDLAIHGKLVKQDPADEPASVMLGKLRAEKEAKIAAGEIKRGKNDSYIYRSAADNCYYQKYADGCEENISDEILFAVPEGWAWCRLPNLCKIPITDGTHQTPTYSDKENGIPFLSSKDVTSRKIDWSKIKYITKELHEELQKRIQPCRNDILLAKNGTTGVAALVDTDKIFDIYVTLAVLRPAEVVHPNYLHYVINSPFCKKQFNGHLTGIGVPNLHLNDICKTIIPLPPLSEQQRIVTKIEELFAQLDFITTALVD